MYLIINPFYASKEQVTIDLNQSVEDVKRELAKYPDFYIAEFINKEVLGNGKTN